MNVLLIQPYHCDLIHSISLPLGPISIATHLKQHGFNVKICDLAVKKISLKKFCRDFRPDVVGLSFPSVKAIDAMLKTSRFFRKMNVPIVWGGSFVDVGDTKHFFDTGLVDIIS